MPRFLKCCFKSLIQDSRPGLIVFNIFFFTMFIFIDLFFITAALAKLQQERIEQRIKEEEQRKKDEEERLIREREERQQREEEQRRREQEAAEELSRMITDGENPDQTQIPSMGEEAEIETEEVPLSLEAEEVDCQVTSTETVRIFFKFQHFKKCLGIADT